MAPDVAEGERALLALPPDQRAAVVHTALLSLDDDPVDATQDEVDAAWRTELRRRIDDIETGKVPLLDVDESHAQLRAELAARHQ